MTRDQRFVSLAARDHQLMERAQALAGHALFITSPNPRVGCVLTSQDGRILGEGHTQQAGGAHAEIMALRDAAARGATVEGATAYVTLEPCSHHGRTGPCCDALIAAGIARVVASQPDPNPRVAGQGFERLRAAGMTVEILEPDSSLAQASRNLNIGFFSRMLRKTPWVRLKIAASLDGKTALPDGSSQWITGEAARRDGHAWRARACAILTGVGTVLHDHPRLDVRLVETPRQPHLVIVDSALKTPPDAALFEPDRKVLIYHAAAHAQDAHFPQRVEALRARGAQLICLPGIEANKNSTANTNSIGASRHVDLRALLADLGQREINELHVEAGQTLNGALVEAGLVDELLLYLAPKLLGQGLGLARWPGPASLADALTLQIDKTELLGPDLRIVAHVAGRDLF